jgi:hypothetical protein
LKTKKSFLPQTIFFKRFLSTLCRSRNAKAYLKDLKSSTSRLEHARHDLNFQTRYMEELKKKKKSKLINQSIDFFLTKYI